MTLVRTRRPPDARRDVRRRGLDQLKHPGRKVDTAGRWSSRSRPPRSAQRPRAAGPRQRRGHGRCRLAPRPGVGSPASRRRLWRRPSCRPPLRHTRSGRSRPGGQGPATDPVPQEPRPARRPPPCRRRHRGQAGTRLPRAHGQRERAPHRPPDPPRGTAPGTLRRPRGQAEGGPGAQCHRRLERPHRHGSGRRPRRPPRQQVPHQPLPRAGSPRERGLTAAPPAALARHPADGPGAALPRRAGRRRRRRLRLAGHPSAAASVAAPSTAGWPAPSCGSCHRWPLSPTARCAFDGDPHARSRPMAPVLGALRDPRRAGRRRRAGRPAVHRARPRPVRGGSVTLDASASSQFVSALLLSGARFDEGVTVHHDGKPVPSLPHIEMTVETLRDAGVVVDDGDVHTWRVEPSEVNALDVQVEPDLSNAAPFLAAALVTGGRVHVPGLAAVHHPGWRLRARPARHDGRRGRARPGRPHRQRRRGGISGVDVDLHDVQRADSRRRGPVRPGRLPQRHPRGGPHPGPRDRPARSPAHASSAASAREVDETGDGLRITPRPLHGGTVHTYADHRMVMAAAVLGLAVPGIVVEDVDTVAKTMPEFTHLWAHMLTDRVPAGA